MSRGKTVASIVILVVLGLHLAPVLHRGERGTLWPFMRWSMYKNSRGPGPVEAHQRRIVAVTASGARDTVTPYLLGLSITVLDQRYTRPLAVGDSSAVPSLIERLNRGRQDPVVEVRLESETHIVTDTGIVRTENPVRVYHAGAPQR